MVKRRKAPRSLHLSSPCTGRERVLQVSLCPSPRKKGTIMGTKGLQQCILILRVVVLGRWGQAESHGQGQPRL